MTILNESIYHGVNVRTIHIGGEPGRYHGGLFFQAVVNGCVVKETKKSMHDLKNMIRKNQKKGRAY